MTEQGWVGWLQALASLDEALAELSRLRAQVEQLSSERDNWRARSGF